MKIEPFLMERMQSTWENLVEYNLSESGVHPMTVNELLNERPEMRDRLLDQQLLYGQSNGTIELRQKIAALYPGATADHVLVTNGTSEANFVNIWSLVEDQDEIALMLPNYMQIWGIIRAFKGVVKPFNLREEKRWRPDLDQLREAASRKCTLIAVCNPNNPTGAVLPEEDMRAIAEIARTSGAWLLADEVYQGAERDGNRTPTFWGLYDKTIITNGLSKAYGLPGLRIGWVVAPPGLIAKLWSYHDYTSIAPAILSDFLATIALTAPVREKIFQRTKTILNKNFPVLVEWIEAHQNTFSMIEPRAGAIAYLKYKLDINSTRLCEKLRHEKSTLVVPGDHFGMDHYLRIGYGTPVDYLRAGLDRIHSTLLELR